MPAPSPWTDERDDTLRALWDAGETTLEIGRRMGVTKNAVIGRAHRLKLTPRPSPINISKSDKPRAPASARPKAGRGANFLRQTRPAPQSRPRAGEPGAAAATAHCLSSLNSPEEVCVTNPPPRGFLGRHCCWPGCDDPVRANARGLASPYCVAHFSVVYEAPAKKERSAPPGTWGRSYAMQAGKI